MTHLCNSNIRTIDDFQALERGLSPVAALANTVLNCPATGLPQNAAVAGAVASPRTVYDFQVTGENSGTQNMSASGVYMAHKLCESDINVDVNLDGLISTSTCLDISHYQMPSITNTIGVVHVMENSPPAGFHFAVVRFTPPVLNGNNDAMSLRAIDPANGTIILDPTNDTDHVVMLHVYNFVNQASTTPPVIPPVVPPTPTTTPDTALSNCVINLTLGVGSHGSAVHCLQDYLRSTGYLSVSTSTDYFGSRTSHALMKWQSAEGISSTGFFGELSMRSFNH